MTFWAAGAAIAGPLISGAMGAGAAESGYEAQAEGARMSDATQRYMYDTNRADNAPFLRNGTNASNRLAYLMGIGGGGAGQGMTADQYRKQLLSQYTNKSTTPGKQVAYETTDDTGHYTVFTDGTRAEGYGTYGPTEQSTVDEAGLSAAVQRAMEEQQRAESSASTDPAYGSLLRKFSRGDLDTDVVYQNGLQFGLDEGRKGIERQQQASGGLLSGATLKALSRFGNDYGTTKTEGAYNRYTQDNTNTYNKLAGIAGSGQTAAAQVGSAGQNYANNVSQTAQGLGNARAASSIAGSNAIGGGLQGAFNNYQGNQFLKQIQGTPNWSLNSGGGFQTGSGTMSELAGYGVF